MKTYRRHYCEKAHRTYRTTAKCLWKRAAWITGEGPYASVANCRALTVILYTTAEDAQKAKQFIDNVGCGGQCHKRHEIIKIETGDN